MIRQADIWYITSFAISLICLLTAVILRSKKKIKWSLIFLIIGALFLRVLVALDPYLHFWDECFHALVAKNFLSHPLLPTLYDQAILPFNYKQWSYSHIWLHKPPLPSWIIALSLKLFGINEFAVRIPSILLSTIAIGLTYAIGNSLFNSRIGWLSAFLQTINGFIIEITGGRIATDHVDVFFFFFIELSIFFAIRQKLTRRTIYILPFTLCLICTIYSKWLPALIVVPVWLILNYERKQRTIFWHTAIVICLTILAVIPWQWYIYSNFPLEANWEHTFNWLHITTVLEGHDTPWYFFIVNATVIWSEAIWIAVIWVSFVIFRRDETYSKRNIYSLYVWMLIPYIFFTIVKTRMPGYVLFTAPAMFIFLALFLDDLSGKVAESSKFKILIRCIQALTIILAFRYSIERIKPFQKNLKETQITETIKNLPNRFQNSKAVFFNTVYGIQIMFYTPYIAYDRIPNLDEITLLKNNGYSINIFDSPSLPNDLRANPNVMIIPEL